MGEILHTSLAAQSVIGCIAIRDDIMVEEVSE